MKNGDFKLPPPQYMILSDLAQACPNFEAIPNAAASTDRLLSATVPTKPYQLYADPSDFPGMRAAAGDLANDRELGVLCFPEDEAHPMYVRIRFCFGGFWD